MVFEWVSVFPGFPSEKSVGIFTEHDKSEKAHRFRCAFCDSDCARNLVLVLAAAFFGAGLLAAAIFLCGALLLRAGRAGSASGAASSEAECECDGYECDDVFHIVMCEVLFLTLFPEKIPRTKIV
jgi:hypothetical protein